MGNVTAKTSGEIASFMTPAKTNITSLKVHFSPKQLGEGDPSPDNVREIVGWDGVEVNGCGKNLVQFFRKTHTATTLENGFANWSSPWRIPNRERQYTYSVYIDNTNGSERACCKIWFRNQDNTAWVDGTVSEGNSIPAGSCGWSTKKITAKSNTYYFCFGFQINKGCTVSNPIVYESDQETTITSDWSSDVGTVYGGYVDLISGELVKEYDAKIFTGDENVQIGNWGTQSFFINEYRTEKSPFCNVEDTNNAFCNMLSPKIWGFYGMTNGKFTCIGDPVAIGWKYIIWKDEFFGETVEECKSKLKELYDSGTPFVVCAKLTEAYQKHYQLTPTQLSSFIGQNNFWSNADYVEIEYELKETEDIQKVRKKIILNQPHIESVKDDLVNFTTDMKAPLKECKVYFNPVQEGSGDPSPDNVRNIVGWDGVNVGLPDEYQEVEYITSKVKSSSHPYINTGIIPNENMRIYLEGITGDDVNGASFLFGSRTKPSSVTTGRFWGITWMNQYRYGYMGDSNIVIKNVNTNESFVIDFNFNNVHSITVNSTTINPKTNFDDEYIYPIFLFGINNGGTLDTGQQGSFSVKKFIIYDNYNDIEPIMNLVSCYRKSDGEIGMYDTVSKTFYTNSGTGTFLKGEDVNNITTNISWSDSVGTVYGGYVDLVKGELVATHMCDALTETVESLNNDYNTETTVFFRCQLTNNAEPISKNQLADLKCDSLKPSGVSIWNNPVAHINEIAKRSSVNNKVCMNMYKNVFGIILEDTLEQQKTKIDSYLQENPIYVSYKLLEPIIHQLTPQQLLTFKGENNIWSDTNGQTEVKFWTH